MRSRYTAFVLDTPGLRQYVLQTWHESTRPKSLLPSEPGLRWLGLQVRRHEPHGSQHASVEFVARSKLAGKAIRLHEISRFVRESGRWFYLDGEVR